MPCETKDLIFKSKLHGFSTIIALRIIGFTSALNQNGTAMHCILNFFYGRFLKPTNYKICWLIKEQSFPSVLNPASI